MNQNYREVNREGAPTDNFVNPYNFGPLPKECNKTVSVTALSGGECLSGSISVTVETLTPLFIPNTTTSSAFAYGGKSYDFFSYEDLSAEASCAGHFARPVIPGSSIRGAVRSAYEAVTNSCLSTCDDEDLLFHRRTTVPKKNCGILTKISDGYMITNAQKLMLNTARYHINRSHNFGTSFTRRNGSIEVDGKELKTGDTVFVLQTGQPFSTSRNYQTGLYGVQALNNTGAEGYKRGVLFLGEKFQRKHHDAVFVPGTESFDISKEDYDRFFKVWEQYQSDSPGFYPHYIDRPEIPVYYDNVGDTVYITPACISKEVFDAQFAKLLGDHEPCGSAQDRICPACALFGMVSSDAEGSLASRVMFRDATPIGFSSDSASDFYEEPRQLPILGTPKISATEFYTEDYSDKYSVWNYDYGIRNGRPEVFTPKLRGRKFYWHSKTLTPSGAEDRADLTAMVRAVKAGKQFSFEIAFDRLTPFELDSLLWTLTFGDNHAVNAHKLGHGKPIGYGSVRYSVDGVTVYKLRGDDLTLDTVPYPLGKADAKFVKAVPADYLRLTNFENAPEHVSYPFGKKERPKRDGSEDSGVYQWFGLNKGNMNHPAFQQVLAKPSEIMKPETQPDRGATIGDQLQRLETARAANVGHSYGTYKAADIKNWVLPYRRDTKTMRSLRAFVDDYDRAEREGDKRYAALLPLIEKAKGKLGDE